MRLFLLLLASMAAGAATPPAIGDTAPAFSLPNLDGVTRSLADSTGKGPVVLLVLRGFPGYQCPLCNRQVADFVKSADAFAKAGARVVMVYPGPRDKGQEFAKNKNLPAHFELLLDNDYAMTNLYGLRWNEPRETAYPSTFLIGRDGRISFVKISKSHGGRTKAEDVLAELAKLR